jgi:hypothetical protein
MHDLARQHGPLARAVETRDQPPYRALLPPLLIALTVVTAGSLVLLAAALTAPPLPQAMAPPLPRVMAVPAACDRVERRTLMQTALFALPTTPAVVDLARLIYTAQTSGTSHTYPGPLLLVVESGTLTAHLAAPLPILRADQPTTVPARDLVLRPGDGLLLPTGAAAAFGNTASAPAVALVAGIFPASPAQSVLGRIGPARWAEAWSSGASVQPLAGGWLVGAAPGAAALTLQRLSLPVGGRLPLTAPGPVDLAVESGALTLEANGGLVSQQGPAGPNVLLAPPSGTTLLPGDAALLEEAARVTVRNNGVGPLELLLLTVTLPAPRASPGP